MRARADRTWRAILRHRFFREVATDAINDRVFARYLRIEYGFVDTAARALGYAVAKAPSFQERRRLGLGLYGLVTDQEQVFVDAFERMGAPANERTGSRAPGARSSAARALSQGGRDGGLRGDPRLHVGGGVDVSDLVLDGRQVAVFEGLHSRLGCASRWRRRLPSMSRGSARRSTQEDRRSPKLVRRDWARSSRRPWRRKSLSTTRLTLGDVELDRSSSPCGPEAGQCADQGGLVN